MSRCLFVKLRDVRSYMYGRGIVRSHSYSLCATLVLNWIPGHEGIPGIEVADADTDAKAATVPAQVHAEGESFPCSLAAPCEALKADPQDAKQITLRRM